jgi:hypothetical protein
MRKYTAQITMKPVIMALALILFPWAAKAQTPVTVAPTMKLQFFSNTGTPLAAGCVFSFAAGTNLAQATYTDSTGTATNSNPIILDAAGRADIWVTNQAYKFVLKSAGGVNCASGTQIWSEDGVTGVLGLLSLPNTWTNNQTFSNPIAITPLVNQIVLGTAPNLTTVNFPAPAGAVTITGPNQTTALATTTTTQTLTNKTLTNPIINGITVSGVPATYTQYTNSGGTGTIAGSLVKLTGAPSLGVVPAVTDTGGVIGICITGCGAAGVATVQQSGNSINCNFDNATTAGDYITISTTTAGDCHDNGSVYPNSGQVIGRVLSTNGVAGLYTINLFGPEIVGSPAAIGCTNFTPVTVVNTNLSTNMMTCAIQANTLFQGALLDMNFTGIESSVGIQTITIGTSLGGGTTCTTISGNTAAGNNQPWNVNVKFFVLTAGAGGTANMSCEYFSSASGGGVVGPTGVVGAPTIAINTTAINALIVTVQMSVANPGNSVTQQGLKARIY